MVENKNFQALQEFVHDEDKIVTVPWLCATLAVTAKDAKELLADYISHSRKSQPGSLSLSYILSGLRENTLTISLVKEDELDDQKDLYDSEPIVEVYSVQRSKAIDLNGIALVDSFKINESRDSIILGSIISKNCVKRNFKLKKNLPSPPGPTLKEKTPFSIKPLSKTNTSSNSLTSKTSNAKVASSPKQSVFNRFFTNGDQNQVKKESVPKTPDDTKSSQKISSLVDSDSDSEPVVTQKQTAKEKQKKPAKKKGSSAKKKESSVKRRKRIVVEEESDDDIFANDNDDEDEEDTSRKRKNVIEDSDEEEPVVKPEPLPELPKNKKRKLVDRTFQDEEGFIITKKEWVEECVSEEESAKDTEVKDEPVVKKEIKQKQNDSPKKEKTANGKPPVGKGKKAISANQTMLTSFFKRK